MGYVYLGARLAGQSWGWALLAVPFLFVWLLPVLYWRRGRQAARVSDQALQIASYVAMAVLSFLLVLSLLRDLLLAGLMAAGSAALPIVQGPAGAYAVVGLALFLTALGMLEALTGPRLKEVEVKVKDLPEALQGLRIAQISDLHVGPTIGERYVRRVVRRTNALSPDAVMLTGDIIDGPLSRHTHMVEPMAALTPAGRVYFVTGNHEYYWDAPAWLVRFRELGWDVLANSSASFTKDGAEVFVGGIVDPAERSRANGLGPDVQAAARGANGAALKILLAHQPQAAGEAEAAGFHLQLSGHTHGGQFFPWTLVVRYFHRHYHGLSRAGRMWVYVSPGTGTWGPPVRLGTRPEVTLIRFVRATA